MRTTSPIAGLFGRSPFRRMQQHMAFVADCVAQMLPLFEALLEEDREKIAALKETVFDLERQADDVKNEIRLHLPRTMFLPVDRRDLLDLLHAQDSIADTAQDVVGLLVLRGMVVPPFMRERLMPFVRSNVDAVNKCQEVINELDELLVTGFKGRGVDRVEEMVVELGDIEREGDELGMALVMDLFSHEEELSPLSVVYWERLINMIGDLADYAQDVGDRLRLFIAR